MNHRFTFLILFLIVSLNSFSQERIDDYMNNVAQADSLIKLGKYTSAETYLKDAIKMQPENPMNVLLMSNIGLLRHYEGNDSAALAMLDSAVQIAPASTTVRSNRGKVLASAGKYGEACEEYSKVLELDSTLVEPRYMRFILQLAANKLREAKRDLEYLSKHSPDAEQTLEASAYIYILEGKFSDAIPVLDKIIKSKKTAENYGRRALCNIMCENLNEASADITDALRLDPMNGEYYLYRAVLNKKRFRPDDVNADIKKAVQLGVNSAKIKQFGLN